MKKMAAQGDFYLFLNAFLSHDVLFTYLTLSKERNRLEVTVPTKTCKATYEAATTAMHSIELATRTSSESVRQSPRPLRIPTVSHLQRGATDRSTLVAERSMLYAAR